MCSRLYLLYGIIIKPVQKCGCIQHLDDFLFYVFLVIDELQQVAPASHWPQLEVLVLVVCAEKKAVSSTSGMQTTVETSSLIQYRANTIVPLRMKQMEEAILNKNFETFGRLTMMVIKDNY